MNQSNPDLFNPGVDLLLKETTLEQPGKIDPEDLGQGGTTKKTPRITKQ
jgi:hypothetical protein